VPVPADVGVGVSTKRAPKPGLRADLPLLIFGRAGCRIERGGRSSSSVKRVAANKVPNWSMPVALATGALLMLGRAMIQAIAISAGMTLCWFAATSTAARLDVADPRPHRPRHQGFRERNQDRGRWNAQRIPPAHTAGSARFGADRAAVGLRGEEGAVGLGGGDRLVPRLGLSRGQRGEYLLLDPPIQSSSRLSPYLSSKIRSQLNILIFWSLYTRTPQLDSATRRAESPPAENDAGDGRSEPYPQPTPNLSDPAGPFPDNAVFEVFRSPPDPIIEDLLVKRGSTWRQKTDAEPPKWKPSRVGKPVAFY
jgi:hypothetical protein